MAQKMGLKNFILKLIHNGFLEDAKLSAETRTKLNLKNIIKAFFIVLALLISFILWLAPDDKRNVAPKSAVLDYTKPSSVTPQSNTPENANHSKSKAAPFGGGGGIGYGTTVGSTGGTGVAARNRNANQVIKRGANGNDAGAQIPLGTMVGARLITAVHSSNTASPVIAQITQEVSNENGTSIPANTKIIGNGSFDEGSHRIQIHFSTLIYEDGSQHPIQAMAMMQDGSAGLDGDYNSGKGQQQVGKFIGNFVGGLANGLRDQTTAGAFGSATQSGSIKNGLLGGVALSAEDVTKSYSDDLTNERPSMSINAGSAFYLFLEKEYLP